MSSGAPLVLDPAAPRSLAGGEPGQPIEDMVDAVRTRSRGPRRVVLSVDEQRIDNAEFALLVDDMARGLHTLGISRGDRVLIWMPNRVRALGVLFGALQLGALPVPINVRYGDRELAHVLADCRPAVAFFSEAPAYPRDLLARLLRAAGGAQGAGPAQLAAGVLIMATRQVLDESEFDQISASSRAAAGTSPPDARTAEALLLYTSGTTAAPRGCVLSHRALLQNARALAAEALSLDPRDCVWNPLPFCHVGALMPFLACLLAGAEFRSTAHFEPQAALAQLRDGCTVAHPSFETIWSPVMEAARSGGVTLDNLRLVHLVGAPSRLRAARAALPRAMFVGGYGSTELAGVVCMHGPGDPEEQRVHGCGRPFPGVELCIRDPDTGRALPADTPGEILVRGYPVLMRYISAESERSHCTDDGWFRTGDRGAIDAQGYLRFEGRIKDMLKVGGENVAALEVESCLGEHPAVLLSQVVGVADRRLGEVPIAFVELAPRASASAEELMSFCASRLAKFKVPQWIRFVSAWPLSGTKIQKAVLRKWAAAP